MVITEFKSFEDIKSQIKTKNSIAIISCLICAKECKTGGKEAMENFAEKLERNGFHVNEKIPVGAVCRFKSLNEIEINSDILIILSCSAGAKNAKKAFPEKKILEALETIGIGGVDDDGKIFIVNKF